MSWFTFLQSEDNANPSLISVSLKREINFDNLENSLFEEEIVALKLNDSKINFKLTANLENVQSEDSYIVVYEDPSNDDFFVVTKSRIIDDFIYFKILEDINKDELFSKKYSIYYGIDNIKYLNEIEDNVYQKITQNEIDNIEDEGEYYDLSTSDTELAYYEVTQSSNKSFQLALYDNGTSWVGSRSTAIGAKAFGIFDGPSLYIIGSKGIDFGKFRIRIFEVLEDGTITKNMPLDWQEIDCFNYQNLSNEILFETEDLLEYKRYIFEIEVLPEKNLSSTSNSVEILKYKFIPNYKIFLESEEINPDVSFIRIGGIR
jgi:hypothetical protein